MIRGDISDSIPIDLIIEILSRLPLKSIARFRCVSKLWESMLGRPYFTELFLTRSSARPRLLFAVEQDRDGWCFFSSSQPQNLYEKLSSTLVLTANILMKFPGHTRPYGHASLIYFEETRSILEEDKRRVPVLCNPSTGKYASLPLPKWRNEITPWTSFLGFDPIDKKFKVLSITSPFYDERKPSQILTLGTGNDSWRTIHCPLNHRPWGEGICINGVLFYFGYPIDEWCRLIICFHFRSDKFKFIYRDFIRDRHDQHDAKLVNYKGKLGAITVDYNYHPVRRCSLKLCMWLIEDVEKPEPDYFSTWDVDYDSNHSVVGVTATGEIVLSNNRPFRPFYLVYVNPEKNTRQTVEIQAFGYPSNRVDVFVDYVEDLKFINMKMTYAAISTYRPGRTFESIKKFDSMRLLDDE